MPWLEIIGWAGSALVVASLAQARVLRFRALNLVGAVLATGYNAVLGQTLFYERHASSGTPDLLGALPYAG